MKNPKSNDIAPHVVRETRKEIFREIEVANRPIVHDHRGEKHERAITTVASKFFEAMVKVREFDTYTP